MRITSLCPDAGFGVLTSVALMCFLPLETWERLGIWMGFGLLIYVFYGRKPSKVRRLAALGEGSGVGQL